MSLAVLKPADDYSLNWYLILFFSLFAAAAIQIAGLLSTYMLCAMPYPDTVSHSDCNSLNMHMDLFPLYRINMPKNSANMCRTFRV